MRTLEELSSLVRERGLAEQRRLSMHCKGPHVSSGAEAAAAIERALADVLSPDPAAMDRVPTELRDLGGEHLAWYDNGEIRQGLARYGALPTSRDVVNELLNDRAASTDANEQEALGALATYIGRVGRDRCGANLRELVFLQLPFDGEAHAYECPQCGVTGTYHAPCYPAPLIDDADASMIATTVSPGPVSLEIVLAISAVRKTSNGAELTKFARLWQHPGVDVSEVERVAWLVAADDVTSVTWGTRGTITISQA